MKKILLLISFLYIFSPHNAFAAVVYVDSSVLDGATMNGSLSNPWKTISQLNAISLTPGSFVNFKAGSNFGSEVLIPRSGLENNPITYTSYGTGAKPIMGGFDATNKSYITVDGLQFNTSTSTAVNIVTSSYVEIKNSVVNSTAQCSGSQGWCPALYIHTNSHHNKIIKSSLSLIVNDTMNDVINLRNYADHNLIENNYIYISGSHTAIGLEGAKIVAEGTANYNIIKNNTIQSGGASTFSTMINSNYNLIEGNIIYGCGSNSTARTQGGLTIDTKNNIVRKNILRDKNCVDSRGIMLESNGPNNVQYNHVYNNIVTGIITGAQGLYVGNNGDSGVVTEYNYFKNNAIYNNGGTNLQTKLDGLLDISTKNIQLFLLNQPVVRNNYFNNNLFYKSDDNNVMWVGGSYQTVTNAQNANSTFFSGNKSANPLFDGQFKPLVNSPTIDAGEFLTKVTSPSGSGSSFKVEDAGYFSDGFDLINGDTIKVGSSTAVVGDIDYVNNLIYVLTPIAWQYGDVVSLSYSGSKPDIGVYEYNGATTSAAYPGPDPVSIPGKIEVENFNVGVEGSAYHDLDASNLGNVYRSTEGVDLEVCSEGGYNLGWTYGGEWLDYEIDVAQSATYDLEIRVAADTTYTGGTFHLEFNGVDKTGPITLPATGGWQTWQTVNVSNISLQSGIQNMKLVLDSMTGGNINYIKINSKTSAPAAPTNMQIM